MIIEQFVRWQLLAWVLTFRNVCRPLRKMYPDLKSLQTTGDFRYCFLWLYVICVICKI